MAKQRQTIAAQVIDDALVAKPKVASRTLARSLFKVHPTLWTTENACCCAVRRLRGAQGNKARREVKPTATRTAEESNACHRWGALLPDAEPVEFQWHTLPEEVDRWLIVADIHVPYHDHKALSTCLAHADGNCDGVLINGDGADAYQLSHFMRDPRKRKFSEEIKSWCKVLDAFKELKPKRLIWKAGNHEFRLERYLMQKAPELFDVDVFNWPTFCQLKERGVEWIPACDPIKHHELTIIHGHEWGNRFSSPVNPARGAFLKAHDCTLEAHGHRTSHHVEHTLRGRSISCWSIGCMCDLNPGYRPLGNKWNHGFAYLNTGSSWNVENMRIVNGEVV